MTPPAGSRAADGRVVFVTTSYPTEPGDPSGHFVAAEASELARAGRRVTVLAPEVRGATPGRQANAAGVEVRWLPAGDAFGWPGALARVARRPWRLAGATRFVLAARRQLRAFTDVERIVAHFLVPSAFPVAAFTPRPALEVVVHGSDLGVVERLPAAVRRRIAASLASSELRCVSEELRARLGEALGPELARGARVQPSPLELGASLGRGAARRLLDVEKEARLVVIVGRLVASKRCEQALRAATLVPRARVVVVGDGPERRRLERRFPDAHFTGQVPRTQALAWLAAADVLLSASEREGAPSVVREARALGTHVVTVAAGDLELWSERDAGLTVVGAAG